MVAPRTYPYRLLLAKLAPYAAVSVLSLAIAYVVLQLWNMTWAIPMYYGIGGDMFGIASLVKTMTETGWFLNAPELAAPFGARLDDVPMPNLIHLFALRVLVALSSDYAAAINLYFLLLFPLTAVTALYALRRLGISTYTAMALGLVFSFLPARFERGEPHLYYAAYFLAPLIALVAVWIIREHELFDAVRRRPTRDGWIAVAAAVLVSWDNPYFVLFAAVLFGAGALFAFVNARRWRAPAAALGLVVIMGAGLFVAFSPSIAYKHAHGPNSAAVLRYPEASELYALSFIQLVAPVEHHRIADWAAKRGYYDSHMFQLVNENSAATLGAVASCGFVGLLCGFIVLRRRREGALWPDLSRLTLVAFLLSTVGGAGAVFTFYAIPEFRAYNRISPIIAFFALIAVGLALQAGRRRIGWAELQPRYVAILVVLTVLAVADQTTAGFVPPYERSAARFQADEALARTVETALPRGAGVFQLPAMEYPESVPVQSLGSYDELAVYLHTSGIRWSFGGMKGRPEGTWAPVLATKPPREMLATALLAGFTGVAVYRRGYADGGAAIERELSALTGQKPIVLPGAAVAFFPLLALAQGVDRMLGSDASRVKTSAAEITLAYGPSFYGEEIANGHHWRWAASDGDVTVRNPAAEPVRATISFSAAGTLPNATLTITAGDGAPQSVATKGDGTPATIDRVFPAGDSAIHFTASTPPVKIGADPRPFSFRLIDLTVHDPSRALHDRVEAFLGSFAAEAAHRPHEALSVRYGSAFYGEETAEGRTWRWASAATEIVVHNDTSRPVKGRLTLIASGVDAKATIKTAVGRESPRTSPLTQRGTQLRFDRTFAPGDTPIRFEPSSRPSKIGADTRTFAFRLFDVRFENGGRAPR
jgi:phosphoglycerol transferase